LNRSRPLSRDEITAAKLRLVDRYEQLAEALLGKPAQKGGNEWRYGSKGSLALIMKGPKRGSWFDHSSGTGGGPLELIQRERGGDFRSAAEWAARDFLRLDGLVTPPPVRQPRREDKSAPDRAATVAAIVAQLRPSVVTMATPAAAYLARRGITAKPPESIRYRPDAWEQGGALVAIATNATGEIQAVQQVYLTLDGKKAAGLSVPKRTNGSMNGAAVQLPGDPRRPIVLAEGPETALSVWQATGMEVWACLGVAQMAKAPLPEGRAVILARDTDAPGSQADETLFRTADGLVESGRAVWIAAPRPYPDLKKTDFNDVLQRDGEAAIRHAIRVAEPYRATVPPFYPDTSRDLAEAEQLTTAAVQRFIAQALAFAPDIPDVPAEADPPTPPVEVLRVGVGIGKTERALDLLASPELAGESVYYLLPEHALADEIAERFNAKSQAVGGPRSMVFRGRGVDHPSGVPMCRKRDLAELVARAGQNVSTTLCHRKAKGSNPEEKCEFYDTCPYIAQMRDAGAGVRFMAHQYGFLPKPEAVPAPRLTIIDESFWQASLRGVEGSPKNRPFLQTDALRNVRYVPGRDGRDDMDATDDLRALSQRAADLLDGGAGPSGFMAAGFTTADAGKAKALEYRCVQDLDISPSMKAHAQRERIEKHRAQVSLRLARFWGILEDELRHAPTRQAFNGIVPGEQETQFGPVPGFYLRWSADLARHIRERPVLVLDATADQTILRRFLPHAPAPLEIEAEWKNVEVIQAHDTKSPKCDLVPSAGANAPELQRRANRRADLRRLVEAEVARAGGADRESDAPARVLAITYKGAALAEGDTPLIEPVPGADFAWLNGVRGKDGWRDVRSLVLAGRTQPDARDVEDIAAALFYRDPSPINCAPEGEYEKRPRGYRMRDGSLRCAEADAHIDPRAEAVRWQVCEAELIQAIGRGRPARRSADRPLRVILLCSVPLPITVDALEAKADILPHPIEVAWARVDGVLPLDPAWLARELPDLFPSQRTAERAIASFRKPAKSLLEDTYRGMADFIRYRVEAGRGSPSLAMMAPGAEAESRAVLLSGVLGRNVTAAWIEGTAPQQQQREGHDAPTLVKDTPAAANTAGIQRTPRLDFARLPEERLHPRAMLRRPGLLCVVTEPPEGLRVRTRNGAQPLKPRPVALPLGARPIRARPMFANLGFGPEIGFGLGKVWPPPKAGLLGMLTQPPDTG